MNIKYMDMLEGVSTFIAPLIPLIVGICFLLSLLFNLGFYLGLNLNLGELPISFIDITNSTIKFSIIAIIALSIGYFFNRREAKDGINADASSNPANSNQGSTTETIFVNNQSGIEVLKDRAKNIFFIIVLLIIMFLWGFHIQFIAPLIVSINWLIFKTLKSSIIGFINLLAMVVGFGYSTGIIARDSERTNMLLTIHDKTFNAYLIQNLEKALVYKTGKSIVVIPWERIDKIEYPLPPLYEGYYCKKYKFCKPKKFTASYLTMRW